MAKRDWLALGFAPVLAASMLVGLACGGDDDDDTTSTPQSGATTPASNGGSADTPAATVPEGAPEVDQDGLAFKPSELTVKTGEAVYFKNSETAIHTVDINGKNESGTMKKGDVFTFTFDTPGEYKITCEFHPQMKATITVE